MNELSVTDRELRIALEQNVRKFKFLLQDRNGKRCEIVIVILVVVAVLGATL